MGLTERRPGALRTYTEPCIEQSDATATTADKVQHVEYRPVQSLQSMMLRDTVLLGWGLWAGSPRSRTSGEHSTRTVRWLLLADAALRIWKRADEKRDDTDHKPHDLPLGNVS
jgi:hypothetical protein